jgi:hypothetical protein
MTEELKANITSSLLKDNVINPELHWLKPSEVAKLLGLDEKWLAAAREGRKGVYGPPFIKIGNGKTSPIRYPLDKLIEWMNTFPLNPTGSRQLLSYSDFNKSAGPNDLWPFILYENGTFEDIFESINSGNFTSQSNTRQLIWLAKCSIPN